MQFDWKSYFIFTAKEQKGIVVLGCILTLSLGIHYLLPQGKIKSYPSKIVNKPVSFFYFDPNTLDSNKGTQLGLTIKQMTTLYHYREKGGRFYKKEDLLKLYGLPQELAVQLLPWVRIKGEDAALQLSQNGKYPNDNRNPLVQIDINNPNLNDWVKRTGLPAYKVKRILKYQKWAGGFTSIQGLQKVYGISAYDFSMIRPYLKYNANIVRKLNVQSMQFDDWMSLGIFDEKTVWSILKLRKEKKGSLSWSELVILFDLTEAEAALLKKKTNLSN